MVNKTINEFNNLTTVASDDALLLWDASTSTTVKISADNLVSATLITSDKIPSIDMSKVTTGSLQSSRLTATGSPSNNTFLRGDYSWSTPNHYNIPTTDNSYYGDTITLKTDDSCSFGQIRYLDSSYDMVTLSNPTGATGLVGMATTSANAGDDTTFLIRGIAVDTAWSYTKGAKLYLGATTGLSSSLLTTSGKIVRIMGYAINSSTIWFEPDKTWIEL